MLQCSSRSLSLRPSAASTPGQIGRSGPPTDVSPADRVTVRAAMRLAALASAVRLRDVRAPDRGNAATSAARHLAIYLVHVGLGVSGAHTARLFARDRATVRYACARIEDRRDDPAFDALVTTLEGAILAASPQANRGSAR